MNRAHFPCREKKFRPRKTGEDRVASWSFLPQPLALRAHHREAGINMAAHGRWIFSNLFSWSLKKTENNKFLWSQILSSLVAPNVVIMTTFEGCVCDDLQCCQWWQSWHPDNSWFSVVSLQIIQGSFCEWVHLGFDYLSCHLLVTKLSFNSVLIYEYDHREQGNLKDLIVVARYGMSFMS